MCVCVCVSVCGCICAVSQPGVDMYRPSAEWRDACGERGQSLDARRGPLPARPCGACLMQAPAPGRRLQIPDMRLRRSIYKTSFVRTISLPNTAATHCQRTFKLRGPGDRRVCVRVHVYLCLCVFVCVCVRFGVREKSMALPERRHCIFLRQTHFQKKVKVLTPFSSIVDASRMDENFGPQ